MPMAVARLGTGEGNGISVSRDRSALRMEVRDILRQRLPPLRKLKAKA